jgi:CRP-like cAMP-binding protein
MVNSTEGSPFHNKLLAKLDSQALNRLKSKAKLVSLGPKELIYRPEQKIRDIYFPETAVISMLTVMEDGGTIESCTVGREGASWISASLHAPSMPCETITAIGGDAYRIDVDTIERELKENGAFHDSVTTYSHALLIQCLRCVACNGLHSLTQRAARWILTTLDRTDHDKFAVTHEFLASLRGSTRSSLSTIVEALDKSGAIEIHRNSIKVADRTKLLKVACECYDIIRRSHAQIETSRS